VSRWEDWGMDWLFSWEVTVGVVLGLVGIAIGVLAMNDFRLAKTCFLIAAADAIGGSVVGVNRTNYGLLTQSGFAFLGCGAIGLLLFLSFRYVDSKRENSGVQPKEKSYLVMRLVIDGMDQSFVQFHFLLKNPGPRQIKISHFIYKSLSQTAVGNSIEPNRTIISGEELIANGSVPRKDLPGGLNGIASYSADSSTETMTAEYGFFVRSIDLIPQKILEPVSRGEVTGETIDPWRAILDGLKQPTGTVTFWFSEKRPDGSPNNLFISTGPDRTITFDAASRKLHFTMLHNGKLYQLERPLLEAKQGKHFIGAQWSDADGVHLFVDGVEDSKPQ
jgi:hypothetical protein